MMFVIWKSNGYSLLLSPFSPASQARRCEESHANVRAALFLGKRFSVVRAGASIARRALCFHDKRMPLVRRRNIDSALFGRPAISLVTSFFQITTYSSDDIIFCKHSE